MFVQCCAAARCLSGGALKRSRPRCRRTKSLKQPSRAWGQDCSGSNWPARCAAAAACSVKDRIAYAMVERAEREGLISPDKTTLVGAVLSVWQGVGACEAGLFI